MRSIQAVAILLYKSGTRAAAAICPLQAVREAGCNLLFSAARQGQISAEAVKIFFGRFRSISSQNLVLQAGNCTLLQTITAIFPALIVKKACLGLFSIAMG